MFQSNADIRCSARGAARRHSGATMMEMLATLSILAILLGTVSPRVSQALARYSLRGAARELFGELQSARAAAQAENDPYVFARVNAHSYRVFADRNSNGVLDPGETVTTLDTGGEWGGISLGGAATLTFLPNGTALAPGTISVTGAAGQAKAVAVSAAGRVSLQ
jgi:Tfp pilus assembly protein FimT